MERSPKGDGAGGEGAGSDINSDSDLDSSASSSDGEMDPNTQFAQYPVRSLSPNSFALSLFRLDSNSGSGLTYRRPT